MVILLLQKKTQTDLEFLILSKSGLKFRNPGQLINGEDISSIRPNNPKSTHTDINENQLNPYLDKWDLLDNIFNSDK